MVSCAPENGGILMERRCRTCGLPITNTAYILERNSVWHIACYEHEEERWVHFRPATEDRYVGRPFPKDEEDD